MKKGRGLYYKFNILIIGSIFLCGILMGAMMLHATRSSLKDGLISTGYETASYLAAGVSSDILVDNEFAIHERLTRTMESNNQIRYIIVSNPDGSIRASTFVHGTPMGLPLVRLPSGKSSDVDTMAFSSNEGTIREVMVPIDEGYIGYIRLGMTEKYMMSVLQDRCLLAIIMVLLVCVVASILTTRYAHEFLKPVARLSFAVKQMEKGKYGIQVPENSGDEVGDLAKTFNKMSVGLQKTIEKNNKLVADLRRKEKNRRWLIQQLFSVRENEQRRISRELHDESSQSMASILTYLRILHDRLDTDEQREMLFEIRELTASTLGGLRRLAVDLHPPLLEDLGLVAAIEKYLEPVRKMHPDIKFNWSSEGDFSRNSRVVDLMCYRTVQETVTNILKYAEAKQVDISMCIRRGEVYLAVRDDGVGFDKETAEKARLSRHLGLVSMRERTELLQGSFRLETSPGSGTKITLILPANVDGGKK